MNPIIRRYFPSFFFFFLSMDVDQAPQGIDKVMPLSSKGLVVIDLLMCHSYLLLNSLFINISSLWREIQIPC